MGGKFVETVRKEGGKEDRKVFKGKADTCSILTKVAGKDKGAHKGVMGFFNKFDSGSSEMGESRLKSEEGPRARGGVYHGEEDDLRRGSMR